MMNTLTLCCSFLLGGSQAVPLPPILRPLLKDDRPIRVVVVDVAQLPKGQEPDIADRLRKLKFDVKLQHFSKIDPDQLKDVDVIVLPTHWGEDYVLPQLDAKTQQFHRFVKRGGGLLACQPNPTKEGTCTPTLLPYPITFKNNYDDGDKDRQNLAPDHFIVEDLAANDMPFPADPIIEIDRRYTVLAKGKSSDCPSLAVGSYGAGRVVVQTANESRGASLPISDEIVRRMVVWSAGRERRPR